MTTYRLYEKLCLSLAALFLVSCTYRPWPPAPYAYELWERPGATREETFKTLLECGYESPFYSKSLGTTAEFVAAQACMEKQQFLYKGKYSWKGMCAAHDAASAPGCQPGYIAPDPDASKRLESKHCHDFPRATVCQK